MKKLSFLLFASSLSVLVLAQGNSQGKGKDKQKDKEKSEVNGKSDQQVKKGNEADIKKAKEEHDKKVWEGTSGKNGAGPKPSKNQPAKVRSNFKADYPNAQNVSWSKYRGDWTASFGNGNLLSTAVYHANGERRDTRTPITKNEMPKNVLDSIFKRRPDIKLEDVIKVEVPNTVKEIFRIKDIIQGETQFQYFDSDGKPVKYDY
jgi:hypothetical protein